MSDDFFGDLGKSISKITQGAADRTNSFLEAAKINARIGGVNREIERLYERIGEAVCALNDAGEKSLGEDVLSLMEEVKARRETILSLRESLASVQGKKVCPACTEIIESDVAFCPRCGAPTPVREEGDLFQDEETEIPIEFAGEETEDSRDGEDS